MTERQFYRSTITPRSSQMRSRAHSFGNRAHAQSTGYRVVTEFSSASMSSNAAKAIVEGRDKERKEMGDLNDRLAGYIEKVRFLEAQNRKLGGDLDSLKAIYGREAKLVKGMFETELQDANSLLGDTAKEKSAIERDTDRMEAELTQLRKEVAGMESGHNGDVERMHGLVTQVTEAQCETEQFRKRIEITDDEVSRQRKKAAWLQSELQKIRSDLDQETLDRVDGQNQVQALSEELEFLRKINQQHVKDLHALAVRDTTAENREFFRNELASAIRDIRKDFDIGTNQNKNDLESWYKLRVQEISTQSARDNMETGYKQEEVRRLRAQLAEQRQKMGDVEGRNTALEKQLQDLTWSIEDEQRGFESALAERDGHIRHTREEIQALMVELQMLLDTKQTLDKEIAVYRQMLEGEDERGGLRVRTQSPDQEGRTYQNVRGSTKPFVLASPPQHSTRI